MKSGDLASYPRGSSRIYKYHFIIIKSWRCLKAEPVSDVEQIWSCEFCLNPSKNAGHWIITEYELSCYLPKNPLEYVGWFLPQKNGLTPALIFDKTPYLPIDQAALGRILGSLSVETQGPHWSIFIQEQICFVYGWNIISLGFQDSNFKTPEG